MRRKKKDRKKERKEELLEVHQPRARGAHTTHRAAELRVPVGSTQGCGGPGVPPGGPTPGLSCGTWGTRGGSAQVVSAAARPCPCAVDDGWTNGSVCCLGEG